MFTDADLAANPRLLDVFHMLNRGERDSAVKELKQQMALQLHGAALLLADVYGRTANFSEAIDIIEHAPELAEHSNAWMLSGIGYINLKKPQAAFRNLKRALDIDWKNHRAHAIAWTALNSLGLLSKAIALARTHIEQQCLDMAPTLESRIELPTVTLCVVDCVYPTLAVRALRCSTQGCRFGAVKLITSTGLRFEDIETVPIIPISSSTEYSAFILKELPKYVHTEHVLVAQWDGYVVNSPAWDPTFLNYDYIGARWTPESVGNLGFGNRYTVGNGGFSLRSKRFLAAVAELTRNLAAPELHPEDAVACRHLRNQLEIEYGIRFAPGDVADHFSFEHVTPEQPTFGFHGVTNLARAINDPRLSRFEFLGNLVNTADQS